MKTNYFLNKILFTIILGLLFLPINAEENKVLDKDLNKNNELNVYTGMFDWSDHGKRSNLVGFQHQNEDLNRDSFLGNISPVTGAMITGDSATYVYTGVQAQYKIGKINLTPSFTPGLYGAGNGKDLGHIVEFKSEVQFSLDLASDTEFGFSYNHISNASLGDKNPGANSYVFNFLKKF